LLQPAAPCTDSMKMTRVLSATLEGVPMRPNDVKAGTIASR
jgi:hypothetical protein